jgi:hypothetical protein
VLNGFGVIALIAAGFGIVNTLLKSVQERTREIVLMKAMGMAGNKVFALFSFEAVFIGFLGSGVGIAGAMLAGLGINNVLAGGLLADLPGLTLVAFDPLSIGAIVLTVMAIAFLAGTIPALRARTLSSRSDTSRSVEDDKTQICRRPRSPQNLWQRSFRAPAQSLQENVTGGCRGANGPATSLVWRLRLARRRLFAPPQFRTYVRT